MTDGGPVGLPGLDEACAALADGRAVVVPNPSPMTYGVVATTPEAVNAVKRRQRDQAVAVSLHAPEEWQRVAGCIDVPAGVLARIGALLRERLSLLVPLREAAAHPSWITPAVRHGYLAMFSGRWEPTGRLWDGFPRLFGSSANRTGHKPAATAAEATAVLAGEAPVVDADALRDLDRPHAASSMVRVDRDGTLSLHRHGAQDVASGLDGDAYIRRLSSTLP